MSGGFGKYAVTPRLSLLVVFLVVGSACTSERSFMESNMLNDFAAWTDETIENELDGPMLP